MYLKTLNEIETEVKRFSDALNRAKKRAKENKGYKSYNSDEIVGANHAAGTKEAGALKRAALDLKRFLTENLK